MRAFRERDKAINDALVSAQQLRGDIRQQAEKEAELILREARANAEKIVEGTRSELRRMEDQLAGLERGRRAYLAHVRVMIERQLSEIAAAEQDNVPDPTVGRESSAGRESQPSRESPASRESSPTPAWLGSLVKE